MDWSGDCQVLRRMILSPAQAGLTIPGYFIRRAYARGYHSATRLLSEQHPGWLRSQRGLSLPVLTSSVNALQLVVVFIVKAEETTFDADRELDGRRSF
jgi:hypothetical protein